MEKQIIQRFEKRLENSIAPVHIVSDFNDYRSHVECEQEMRSIFRKNGVLYEPPHIISDVEQFNITDGAFKIFQLVNNLRRHEHPGIFVGVVDPGVGSERKGVVVTTKEGYTFVGPDNGLFSPALQELTINNVYHIKPDAFQLSSATFHGRDQFTPVAAELASGKNPDTLQQLQTIDSNLLIQKPFVNGQIVETDGYPNVKIWQDSGVPKSEDGKRPSHLIITSPRRIRRGLLWSHHIKIPLVNFFEDVGVGEWGVLEGSSGGTIGQNNKGIAEVFIRDRSGNQGAGSRLNARIGDVLQLQWKYKG